MQFNLKIDVDTFRGTREGVPALAALLTRLGVTATFLFSLGPDHTGRAIKRMFRPGFLKKVSRTSVLEHYGLRTLLYGTLLPAPDIGLGCADELIAVRDAGFEVGIHTWDHIRWQDGVTNADEAWTEREMRLAHDRFTQVFGSVAIGHGAAGWQMNQAAVRLTQQLGFRYASDTRGTHPFLPVWDAQITRCPQIPTTLPTLDELIGLDGVTSQNVHTRLLELTAARRRPLEVFTLHAELEGMKLRSTLEMLIQGWRDQGYSFVTLADVAEQLDLATLPYHRVLLAEVPGRSGVLACQGPEFLPANRAVQPAPIVQWQ